MIVGFELRETSKKGEGIFATKAFMALPQMWRVRFTV